LRGRNVFPPPLVGGVRGGGELIPSYSRRYFVNYKRKGVYPLSKKILIIEDEDEFFFFYTTMFEGTDYIVNRALDGKQAFEKIKEDKPDLIILDLLLDEMTGDAFLKQMKSDQSYTSIPIIVASSFSPRSYKTIFEIDPALVFLEKPFTQERLLASIKARLG